MANVTRLSALGFVVILAACAAVLGCHSGRYYDEGVGDYMVYPVSSDGGENLSVRRYGGFLRVHGKSGVLVDHLEREKSVEARQECEAPAQGREPDDAPIQPNSTRPAEIAGAKDNEDMPKSKPNNKSLMEGEEDPCQNGGGATSGIGAKMRQFDSPEGKKTFRLGDDGIWRDDSCDPASKDAITVKYISDEYYNLLKAKPEVGKYVKLGEKIVVKIAGKTYIIEGIKE